MTDYSGSSISLWHRYCQYTSEVHLPIYHAEWFWRLDFTEILSIIKELQFWLWALIMGQQFSLNQECNSFQCLSWSGGDISTSSLFKWWKFPQVVINSVSLGGLPKPDISITINTKQCHLSQATHQSNHGFNLEMFH